MALSTLVMVGETKEWLSELSQSAEALKVDGGFEKGTDLGPVISPDSKRRIEQLIGSAEEEGATILLDGRGYKPDKYPNGNWVGPTIITDVKVHMKCYREEIFGPVLVCLNVDTFEEAITLVNANEYGNGVAIFTRSGASAAMFQKKIEPNTPLFWSFFPAKSFSHCRTAIQLTSTRISKDSKTSASIKRGEV